MRIATSRWTTRSALVLCLMLGAATGCKSGASGWSTPSWLSMNNWGWGNSSSSSSLAQSKPSTSVPRPSGAATPQAVSSVAAGTNPVQPTATNPNYNPNYSATAGAYPNSAAGYGSYGAQTASANQQSSTAGQVQPTAGYQTGPY